MNPKYHWLKENTNLPNTAPQEKFKKVQTSKSTHDKRNDVIEPVEISTTFNINNFYTCSSASGNKHYNDMHMRFFFCFFLFESILV